MNQRVPFYKRKYFVYPKFQLQLLLYILGFYILIIGSLYAILSVGLKLSYDEMLLISPTCGATLQESAAHQLRNVTRIFLVFSAISLILTAVGGILLSHRAVGPIVRLRRLMRAASEGAIPEKISCRKNDFFAEIFSEFEHFLTRIETKKRDDQPK
jgi:hypothetical protein